MARGGHDLRPSRRSTFIGGAAALVAARSSGAKAAGTWDEIVRKAKQEGEVLLYSTKADADNARLLAGFANAYPDIKAKAVRLVGGAMVTRVEQELKAGSLVADVLLHAERQWGAIQAKEGRLVVPSGPSLALWKGVEKHYADGQVQVTAEPWVIGYNTRLVKAPPTDWDSLLERTEYKGRIGLNEVSGLTVAIWFDFLEKKKPGYMERLAKLSPRIYPNSAPLTAGLSSGEIAWAPYSLASTIEPVKAKGAPIDWVFPTSGTWSIERDAMVMTKAPHPNAGLVLLDYMMSQEGQQILNTGKSGYSIAPGVKVTGGLDVDLSKIAEIDYVSYGDAATRRWQQRVDELFRH